MLMKVVPGSFVPLRFNLEIFEGRKFPTVDIYILLWIYIFSDLVLKYVYAFFFFLITCVFYIFF
jgi:hypothetical protein